LPPPHPLRVVTPLLHFLTPAPPTFAFFSGARPRHFLFFVHWSVLQWTHSRLFRMMSLSLTQISLLPYAFFFLVIIFKLPPGLFRRPPFFFSTRGLVTSRPSFVLLAGGGVFQSVLLTLCKMVFFELDFEYTFPVRIHIFLVFESRCFFG